MKKCYKCQKSYLAPDGPGFQDVCEGCSSYLHCCMNCYFHDPYQHNQCTESQAEFVSDRNGMNHCEYFNFKSDGGAKRHDDHDGGRRFRKPDWRNVNKSGAAGKNSRDRGSAGGLFKKNAGGSMSSGAKAQKAREALENLFKKE